MKKAVLDSFAVLAFLFKEPGHEKVLKLLETATEEDETVFVAAPNWAEIRYIVQRRKGVEEWNLVRDSLLSLPIQVVSIDRSLAESTGEIKATKRMSLADCFAAALAKDLKAELYTGDPEFKEVEKEIKIIWLSRK